MKSAFFKPETHDILCCSGVVAVLMLVAVLVLLCAACIGSPGFGMNHYWEINKNNNSKKGFERESCANQNSSLQLQTRLI